MAPPNRSWPTPDLPQMLRVSCWRSLSSRRDALKPVKNGSRPARGELFTRRTMAFYSPGDISEPRPCNKVSRSDSRDGRRDSTSAEAGRRVRRAGNTVAGGKKIPKTQSLDGEGFSLQPQRLLLLLHVSSSWKCLHLKDRLLLCISASCSPLLLPQKDLPTKCL